MYKELIINFKGKKTSILIDCLHENKERIPCFIVGLSSHYHDKFSSSFRSKFQIVLLDLYWTNNDYEKGFIQKLSLKNMVDDIEEVRSAMEKLQGERYRKILMLGHSAYGFLCLEYALCHGSHLYGIINAGTPTYFKENKLQELQSEYIDANFGPEAPSGPNQAPNKPHERWSDYYQFKQEHEKQMNKSPLSSDAKKDEFVRWYTSMGPLLWKNRSLWRDDNKKATALWKPWRIRLRGEAGKETSIVRDLNMTMLSHYFELATKVDYRTQLSQIDLPVLWFIGLLDARVSLYFFDTQKQKIPMGEKFDLYYINTGHWPMYEEAGFEFDNTVKQWANQNFSKDNMDEKEIYSWKL